MTKEEFNYLISEKIRIDKRLLVVCGKDLTEPILNALQIADRLEQFMTDEQTADYIIVDVECVNNKHDKEVWMSGYNQALADIRGDNDGN